MNLLYQNGETPLSRVQISPFVRSGSQKPWGKMAGESLAPDIFSIMSFSTINMKIALVCPYDLSYPGGVQNHVMDLALGLRARGHEVTIIAPASRDNSRDGLFSVGKGVPVRVPGSATVSRVSLSVWNYHGLGEHFKKEKYDIIHIHSPETLCLGPAALLLADNTRSAIIATFHSNAPASLLNKLYAAIANRLDKHFMGKVDAIAAVSETAKQSISQFFHNGEYAIIPNPVNEHMFHPVDKKPLEQYDDGKVNILFVGRVGEPRKGLVYLVEAFNQLHWNHPDTRLLVVGPGDLNYSTRNIVNATTNPDIVIVGGVPLEQLVQFYQTADIFCSPATGKESFGIVLLEAAACGKPVVASRIRGYEGVLMPDCVLLVPPKNPDELASALETLVMHPELRAEMGKKGREQVVDQYSLEKVTELTLQLYQSVLSKRSYELSVV